jgi:hypothetical protein
MYGRYTKDLSEYAKDEARRLKQLERQRKKDDRARDKVSRDFRTFFRETMNIKQQSWELAGTPRQTTKGKSLQILCVVLESLVC